MKNYVILYLRNFDRFSKSIEKFIRNDDEYHNGESKEIFTLAYELRQQGFQVYLSNFKDVDINTLHHRNLYDINDGKFYNLDINKINEKVIAVIPRMLGSIEAQRENVLTFFNNLKTKFIGIVINHPDTVAYALNKFYLKDLVPYGINTPKSDFYNVDVSYGFLKAKYDVYTHVIKPLTGELGNSVCLLSDISQEFLDKKKDKVGGWIIQPFQKNIWNGERQYLFINGELVYAYLKAYINPDQNYEKLPKLHDLEFRKNLDIRAYDLDLCYRTLSVLNHKLKYITYICRFDIIDDSYGEPMIMECEMINPSFRSWYLPLISKKIVNLLQNKLLKNENNF